MPRLVLACVLLVAAAMEPRRAVPADVPTPPVSGVTALEDRLKSGLRVRAPRETRFIETVAVRVREGRLPAKLVDSTYIWAIQRGRKYPFPAFEHVIRIQAERLNVPLEPR